MPRSSKKNAVNKPARHAKSIAKRIRQNEEHRMHNRSRRSSLKTSIKKLLTAIKEKQQIETVDSLYRKAQALLDRYATKRLIHKNKAARRKSAIVMKIKQVYQDQEKATQIPAA